MYITIILLIVKISFTEGWDNMKRLLFLFAFLLIFIIAVPASATEIVTLNNVSQKDVHDFIIAENMKNGYTIKSATDYSLVFENNKPKDTKFILAWGTSAKVLHVYNLVQSGSDVITSLEIQIITDPDSAKERVHVASMENAKGYFPSTKPYLEAGDRITKNILQRLKATFNGIYWYCFDYTFKKDYTEVLKNWPGMSAEKAGLKVGDRIIKVNDIAVKSLNMYSFDDILKSGDENATVNLIVQRDGKEIPITITKQFVPPTYKKQ